MPTFICCVDDKASGFVLTTSVSYLTQMGIVYVYLKDKKVVLPISQ